MTNLNTLIGKQITEVRCVHDYVQIVFDDSTLSIYSSIMTTQDGKEVALNALVHKKLIALEETESELAATFDRGVTVHINKSEGSGPEILALIEPGQPLIVWSA
jgi:hypothetical protein